MAEASRPLQREARRIGAKLSEVEDGELQRGTEAEAGASEKRRRADGEVERADAELSGGLCAKRPRRQGVMYGGRRRVEKRKRTTAHVTKVDTSVGHGGHFAASMQVGAMVVHRVVDGRYDWRDGGYVARRRKTRGGDGVEWRPGII